MRYAKGGNSGVLVDATIRNGGIPAPCKAKCDLLVTMEGFHVMRLPNYAGDCENREGL